MSELNRPQMMAWETRLSAAISATESRVTSADVLHDRLRGVASALRGALELLHRLSAASSSARAELDLHREGFNTVLQGMPIPCFVTTREGVIVDANPAASRAMNVSVRALLGRSLLVFFDDRDAWQVLASEVHRSRLPAERAGRFRPREHLQQCADVRLVAINTVDGPGICWFLEIQPAVPRGKASFEARRFGLKAASGS